MSIAKIKQEINSIMSGSRLSSGRAGRYVFCLVVALILAPNLAAVALAQAGGSSPAR